MVDNVVTIGSKQEPLNECVAHFKDLFNKDGRLLSEMDLIGGVFIGTGKGGEPCVIINTTPEATMALIGCFQLATQHLLSSLQEEEI